MGFMCCCAFPLANGYGFDDIMRIAVIVEKKVDCDWNGTKSDTHTHTIKSPTKKA